MDHLRNEIIIHFFKIIKMTSKGKNRRKITKTKKKPNKAKPNPHRKNK